VRQWGCPAWKPNTSINTGIYFYIQTCRRCPWQHVGHLSFIIRPEAEKTSKQENKIRQTEKINGERETERKKELFNDGKNA
jgi:hypothetical protein